jgi:hypothetical protein
MDAIITNRYNFAPLDALQIVRPRSLMDCSVGNRNRNVISRILHPVRTKRDERLLAEVMGERLVDYSESDLDEILVSLKDALR